MQQAGMIARATTGTKHRKTERRMTGRHTSRRRLRNFSWGLLRPERLLYAPPARFEVKNKEICRNFGFLGLIAQLTVGRINRSPEISPGKFPEIYSYFPRISGKFLEGFYRKFSTTTNLPNGCAFAYNDTFHRLYSTGCRL